MTRFYRLVRAIVVRFIFTLLYPLKIVGKENIPLEGAVILCANHISMLDPLALILACPRQIRFMAKEELFANKLVGWVLKNMGAFSIKRGESDLASVRLALQILKEDNVFGIFPEGHREKGPEAKAIHSGTSMIALRSGAVTVPVYISGKWRLFRRTTVYIREPVALDEYKPANVRNMELANVKIADAIWQD